MNMGPVVPCVGLFWVVLPTPDPFQGSLWGCVSRFGDLLGYATLIALPEVLLCGVRPPFGGFQSTERRKGPLELHFSPGF